MSLTIVILVITCVVSFLAFNNRTMFDKLKHYPAAEHQRKDYYRWLTSGFLHGDYMHLIINMFVFHSFGTALEQYYTYHFGMIGGSILFGVTYLCRFLQSLR